MGLGGFRVHDQLRMPALFLYAGGKQLQITTEYVIVIPGNTHK